MSTATDPDAAPHHGSQAAQTAPTRKLLSCTSCRQRKIKCNKVDPCHPCLKYGIECIFPTRRIRAPHGKRHAPDARDAELLRRVRRLEEMLASKVDVGVVEPNGDKFDDNLSSNLASPLLNISSLGGGTETGIAVNDQYAAFVKQQGSSSRHLNSEFWSSLGNEVDGLRQLIEDCNDDEDDFNDSRSASVEAMDSSPSLIFQGPDSFLLSEAAYPSDAHRTVLFQFYFANVDPVCKILYRPVVNTYFSDPEALLDPLTRRLKFPSLEAVTFAAYFAAVTSMSPQECLTHLGEQRNAMLARYDRSTKAALAQADFLNSLELATLQALTIYIMAQHSLNRGRSSWTLIGLAMRIAHNLGLHRDGDGRAYTAFEAEMRRRLWWQLIALDLRASENRGSEAVLAENSFNTPMPCNLNDEDFSYDSQHPLRGKTGPTQMTLCLLSMDALYTGRKINFRSPAHGSLTLQEREDLIKKYSERVHSTYLAGCDLSHQHFWLLRTMGHYWIYKLWLSLYYPLDRRSPSQHVHDGTQGLGIAVTFLNINELIEQHQSSAAFAWLFKTYIPWHAVAVTLAELCTQPQDHLADRAWGIIDSRFKDWTGRLTDTKEIMLWGPIKNLLKRARVAQQDAQDVFNVGQACHPSDLDSDPGGHYGSGMSNPGQNGGTGSSSYEPQSFDDFHLTNPSTDHLLDLVPFAPTNTMAAAIEIPSAPNSWDNWNDFMFDVDALGAETFTEPYNVWPMHAAPYGTA